MFAALAILLGMAWVLGFAVFPVGGDLIHLLLLAAFVAFAWHHIGWRRAVA
jgi:hypothetical protein